MRVPFPLRLRLLAVCLCAFVILVLFRLPVVADEPAGSNPAGDSPAGRNPAADAYTFSGYVYVGSRGTSPLAGCRVILYGSNDAGSLGSQLDSANSGFLGGYALHGDTRYAYFTITEAVPAGYYALIAEHGVGGEVVSATQIRYTAAGTGEHADNIFRVSALPTSVPTATSTPTRTPTRTNTPTATRTRTPTATATAAQLLELCAQADTTVSEQGSTSNYGDSTLLAAGSASGLTPVEQRRYILLSFVWPTIPQGMTVQSAVLRLRLAGASGDVTHTMRVYPIGSAWQEMTVTWANQPSFQPGAVAEAVVGSSAPSIVEWNITGLVQEWVSGARPNFGLELRGDEISNWLRGFDSREAPGGYCPRLILGLQGSGTVPSLTPSVTPLPSATPTRTPTPTATTHCPSEPPTGSSFDTAVALTNVNQTAPLHASICPISDEDWFKFPATIGQFITARLQDLPDDCTLTLYRPDGSYYADSAFESYDEEIAVTADQNGDWRLAVRARVSVGQYMYYALTASVCAVEDEDAPGAPATLLPDVPRDGYLCPAGDEDRYVINVPKAQDLHLAVWLRNVPADYDYDIYAPDGSWRATTNNTGTSYELYNIDANNTPGLWQVRVRAKNGVDADATHPYQIEIKPFTGLDLTVAWIEATQATQKYMALSEDDNITLVTQKPTLARVYVDIGQSAHAIEDVAVELHGWRNGAALPGSPLYLGARTVTKISVQDQRLSEDGFNVLLPASWQGTGTLGLHARVWALSPQQPETNTTNNDRFVNVKFAPSVWVDVAIVGVRVGDVGPCYTCPSEAQKLNNLLAYTSEIMPISEVHLWLPSGGLELIANYDYTNQNTPGCGTGWGALLKDLAAYRATLSGPPAGFSLYGLLHHWVPHHFSGCGLTGKPVAAGILSDDDVVLAHELGHNYGLPHAPCGGPQSPDPGFPTYANPKGGTFPSGSIGEVGVRLRGGGPQQVYGPMTIYDPDTARDFMSYCDPSWISPHNYKKLEKAFLGLNAMSVANSPVVLSPHLIAIGEVNGAMLDPDPLWVRDMPASPAQAGEGAYRIVVQDAAGAELASRAFDDAVAEEGLFAETMPYPAGAARVVFLHWDQVLSTITPSAHPPTVTLTYPNGGETWAATGTYTVTWQMSDADDDPLRANVLYSRDNGATWNALAVNLTTTQYAVDAASIAGSQQARLRIEVSDGLNTTSDTSAAPLSIPNKAPLVFALNPGDGAVFAPGQVVLLQGLATDYEDGPLSAENLRWSSDRDGALGVGASLAVDDLSVGWHTLTATIQDSAGQQGQITLRLLIGQRVWLPRIAGAGAR